MARIKRTKLTLEQKFKSAREYLSDNDHNAADFSEKYDSILALCETVDKGDVDEKLYHSVCAMVGVHCARSRRRHRGRHSHQQQQTFSSSDTDQVHPLYWTQKYWKFQRRLQQSAAMPPPATHPRHRPFQLPGPDGKMIDHARCRERWNLLRVLQFDLLYMSFRTEMSRDIQKARVWQLTPEGSMIKELSDQKMILDLGANWDSISQVPEAIKIQRMEPLGVDLFMFEGCQKSSLSNFRHLKEAEQEKLMDMAQRRLKLGLQDRKTYDRLRGKLLNEMERYETLVKAFADDEASYTDRRLATKRSYSLRELAQPLNTPDNIVPRDKKAKELLAAAILRENIKNERSRLIDHTQNWAFAREIDQETRRRKYFSLDDWWDLRGPSRKDSSSSDSSGPHQPPGGGRISIDQFSPIREQLILGQPLDDQIRNEPEEGNAALAGWDGPGNPTDYFPVAANRHHSLIESSVDSSSGNPSFDVGSGMLVPPEVLGLSSVGVHDNDVARTNSLNSNDKIRQVNDAQIAEVRRFREMNDQHDARGVAVPAVSATSRAPPTTSQRPPSPRKNIVQAEAAPQKMSMSTTSSAVEMRQAPVMTTSAVRPTFSQRPPSPSKITAMRSSQKLSSVIQPGPQISTTRPNSPAKRPAESELNPPAKRLFPKWDAHQSRSTAQQNPEPTIDPVNPPLSSTALSPLSRSLADQLNASHKRPAPVAPSSPRKKRSPTGLPGLYPISAAAHATSQGGQPRSLFQASSIKASVKSAVDIPKTPTTPTFRSPRKAPAPPAEQQSRKKSDEPTEPPLSADDIFAVGFPKQFGQQETGGEHFGLKAAEQSSSRLPIEPNPFNLPALSRGNSPEPTFGKTAWAEPNLAPGQFGFGKPSFPQQTQSNRPLQPSPSSLTPPPNPPPPRSPPPFPTVHSSAPSPPSTTRSSLPIASLSTIRQLGLPPEKDDDSSYDEEYPYKSQTVSDFQRALRANAHDDDREADANEGNMYVRENKQMNPPRNPLDPYSRPRDPKYFSFADRVAQDEREEREERIRDARAELEKEEEDEDVDSELNSDDDLDDDDDPSNDNTPAPIPPTSLLATQGTAAQPGQAINLTPGWSQTRAPITGTEEAWTRPGGAGVSTRGRVSSPLEGDDGTAELAEELEGELDAAAEEDYAGDGYQENGGEHDEEYDEEGEDDDDESLYPDRAAAQEIAPEDEQQQAKGGVKGTEGEEGNEDRSIDLSLDDEVEGGEERVEDKDIDSLFDYREDEDPIDWSVDDLEESMS